MNKKRFWFIIPTALLPYLVLFALATVFFSTKYPFFERIMVSVFHGNAIILLIALSLYCLLAAVISIWGFVISIRMGWDCFSLVKSAMIVKLMQVPAYILIFVLSVLLATTIFTIPFSIGLFLIDCLTLYLTGLVTIAAAVNTVRQDKIKSTEALLIIILQFIFCVDIVASIVFYARLKAYMTNVSMCRVQ